MSAGPKMRFSSQKTFLFVRTFQQHLVPSQDVTLRSATRGVEEQRRGFAESTTPRPMMIHHYCRGSSQGRGTAHPLAYVYQPSHRGATGDATSGDIERAVGGGDGFGVAVGSDGIVGSGRGENIRGVDSGRKQSNEAHRLHLTPPPRGCRRGIPPIHVTAPGSRSSARVSTNGVSGVSICSSEIAGYKNRCGADLLTDWLAG